MKRFAYHILLILFAWFSLEAVSLLGLSVLKATRGHEYQPFAEALSTREKTMVRRILSGARPFTTYHSTLGWRPVDGGRSQNGLSRSNAMGIRSDRDYALEKPPAILRLLAFGDSFTFGDDVRNEETWEAQLEAMDSRLEVLNFGVGGYSLDQAFLRYREEGPRFHADVVLIGYMAENIHRLLNTFRLFYDRKTLTPLAKPRFILAGGQLSLVPNPVSGAAGLEELLDDESGLYRKIKAEDYHAAHYYKSGPFDFLPSVRLAKLAAFLMWRKWDVLKFGTYDTSHEAYQILTRLLDEFYRQVQSDSATPVIVIFPRREDARLFLSGRKTTYAPLVQYLNGTGYRYIDLIEVFKAPLDGKELRRLIPAHYSAEANRLVAERIFAYLQAHHLLT